MKKILIAALMAGVASTAFAADLPTKKAAPPPVSAAYAAPAFSWTGFYLGINGGYNYGSFRGAGNATFGHPVGGAFGGQAGYNYQIGQFVLGVEDNLDWSGARNSNTVGANSFTSRVNMTNTLFGRAGIALDRALIFGEAGYSGAEVKGVDNGLALSSQGWRSGVGVGAGLEYAITNNVSARADYVWSYLGQKTYFAGTPDQVKTGLDLSQVRAGLNYKF